MQCIKISLLHGLISDHLSLFYDTLPPWPDDNREDILNEHYDPCLSYNQHPFLFDWSYYITFPCIEQVFFLIFWLILFAIHLTTCSGGRILSYIMLKSKPAAKRKGGCKIKMINQVQNTDHIIWLQIYRNLWKICNHIIWSVFGQRYDIFTL